MFWLIVEGAVIVMAFGLLIKVVLDTVKSRYRIDWTELAVASAIMLLIVVPLTAYIGTQLAVKSQVTYHENWGGWETDANKEVVVCRKNGICHHHYDCDPYTVMVDYECGSWEGSGNDSRYVSKTCQRPETRYESCPYTSEEWTFTVDTTLGEYVIADHNLPTNPNEHRWRAWVSVPSGIPSGVPPFWTAVKERLEHGDPGPVTARRNYENYVLASQHTILKRYSDSVGHYKQIGLLPELHYGVSDLYFEPRVYFEGVRGDTEWQEAINRFDAALGYELQGDLHVVIVDGTSVTNPDNYLWAVLAYWQSPQFEKDAFSKNGILVVLGTTDGGQTVAWARAATGMPEGNEALLLDVQNSLKGVRLTPEAILGHPQASVTGPRSVSVSHPEPRGALEKVLWGEHVFKRVHMGKPGKSGNVGYSYLLREVEPTDSQRFWILFATSVFALIAWIICAIHGTLRNHYRDPFGPSW